MELKEGLRDLLKQIQFKQTSLLEQKTRVQQEVQNLSVDSVLIDGAAKVLQELIGKLSIGEISELEKLISWGLQTVFEEPYQFKIDVETKRGVKVFSWSLINNGNVSAITAIGGGVQTVIAFLLRLYSIAQLKLPKILFLDEYFHNLDEQRIPAFIHLCQSLCKDYQFDVLAVTHYKDVIEASNRCYHLEDCRTLKEIKKKEYGG